MCLFVFGTDTRQSESHKEFKPPTMPSVTGMVHWKQRKFGQLVHRYCPIHAPSDEKVLTSLFIVSSEHHPPQRYRYSVLELKPTFITQVLTPCTIRRGIWHTRWHTPVTAPILSLTLVVISAFRVALRISRSLRTSISWGSIKVDHSNDGAIALSLFAHRSIVHDASHAVFLSFRVQYTL